MNKGTNIVCLETSVRLSLKCIERFEGTFNSSDLKGYNNLIILDYIQKLKELLVSKGVKLLNYKRYIENAMHIQFSSYPFLANLRVLDGYWVQVRFAIKLEVTQGVSTSSIEGVFRGSGSNMFNVSLDLNKFKGSAYALDLDFYGVGYDIETSPRLRRQLSAIESKIQNEVLHAIQNKFRSYFNPGFDFIKFFDLGNYDEKALNSYTVGKRYYFLLKPKHFAYTYPYNRILQLAGVPDIYCDKNFMDFLLSDLLSESSPFTDRNLNFFLNYYGRCDWSSAKEFADFIKPRFPLIATALFQYLMVRKGATIEVYFTIDNASNVSVNVVLSKQFGVD